MGTKEELVNFITLVFKTCESDERDIIWSEDPKHNMSSFKYNNLVFKYYTTTSTLHIQGQKEKDAKEKLFGLLIPINEEVEQDGGDDDTEEDRGNDHVQEVIQLCDSTALGSTISNNNGTVNKQFMEEMTRLKEEFYKLKCVVESMVPKENMLIQQNHTFVDSCPVDEVEMLRKELFSIQSTNQCLSTKVEELEKEKASLLTVIRLLKEDKTESNSTIDSNLVNVTSACSDDQVTGQPFEKVKKKKKRKNTKTQDKQTTSSASVPNKKCSK